MCSVAKRALQGTLPLDAFAAQNPDFNPNGDVLIFVTSETMGNEEA